MTIGAAAGGPFNIAQSLPQIAPRFAEVGFACTSFETHNLSHRSDLSKGVQAMKRILAASALTVLFGGIAGMRGRRVRG